MGNIYTPPKSKVERKKNMVSNKNLLFEASIFRFHVKFGGKPSTLTLAFLAWSEKMLVDPYVGFIIPEMVHLNDPTISCPPKMIQKKGFFCTKDVFPHHRGST